MSKSKGRLASLVATLFTKRNSVPSPQKGVIVNVFSDYTDKDSAAYDEKIVMAVQDVKNFLLEKGYLVHIVETPVYSYQGGAHVPYRSPDSRPTDWDGTPYGEDILVCVGTADRYGYVAEQRLRYVEITKPSEKAVRELMSILEGVQDERYMVFISG